MLEEQQFTRIRALTNAIIAAENLQGKTRTVAAVRRTEKGARITVSLQEGTPRPSDPLGHLGALCDQIGSELRLERDSLGRRAFDTSESTFTSGNSPTFTFEVW